MGRSRKSLGDGRGVDGRCRGHSMYVVRQRRVSTLLVSKVVLEQCGRWTPGGIREY